MTLIYLTFVLEVNRNFDIRFETTFKLLITLVIVFVPFGLLLLCLAANLTEPSDFSLVMPRTAPASASQQELVVYTVNPLMYLVWHGHATYLTAQLEAMRDEDEDTLQAVLRRRDLRGRTLLQLAVALFRKDEAGELMAYGAQVEDKDHHGFNVMDNVITTQDLELLHSTYLYWQYQRCANNAHRIIDIFNKFSNHNRDFYFEIDHTFDLTPAGALVSVYPYTKYRVYKLGHKVCFELVRYTSDTQFKLMSSFIFVVSPAGGNDNANNGAREQAKASMAVLDHTKRTRIIVAITTEGQLTEEQVNMPDRVQLVQMVNAPLVSTIYGVENLRFEATTSMFGLTRTDLLKEKYIKQPNRHCAVYKAKWLIESTFVRTEHVERNSTLANLNFGQLCNPHGVTLTDYFMRGDGPDIGIERKIKSRYTKQKVKLWMFKDNYPLSVKGHLVPVLELLGLVNKTLDKCRTVVCHPNLPHSVGYPIKVEFFLPDSSSAISKVKFTNFNGLSEPNANVTAVHIRSPEKFQYRVTIKPELFTVPQNYYVLGGINI